MGGDGATGDASAGGDPAEALLALVQAVVDEVHRGRGPTATWDARLDADLGLDSLSVVELVARCEDRFGIAVTDDLLASAATPRDLLGAMDGDGAARPSPVGGEARPLVRGGREITRAPTLVDVLLGQVEQAPDRVHLRVLGTDADAGDVTFGDLQVEAARVAAGLAARGVAPGASVAIMLPTSRAYFATFAGILLAGCVPVPLYPPARPAALEEHLDRHVRILDNAQAVVLVTVPEAMRLARLVAPRTPSLRHVVTPEELATSGTGAGSLPAIREQDLALLQYTSGSTGNPKGVMLTHANLLANVDAMGQAGEVTGDDVFVSWLPLYHDMGLIGAWFTSLVHGIPLVVMSPLRFLARPAAWLQAITDHGGTISGGPNFGYELCLRRITDDDLVGIDLSSWRVAFNGAEPVSPKTVTRFPERFADVGFGAGVMAPVYGLAENSVALTVPPMGRGVRLDHVDRQQLAHTGQADPVEAGDARAVAQVGCGHVVSGHEVRIVDRDSRVLSERQQGRIQFRGPSATAGYIRNPAATRRLFDGDWLDSCDLGYLADGELFVTGRIKDLIIRAGRNLHPAELEHAVGEIPDVRRGCVAVFAATDVDSGTERLVVLAETRATDRETHDAIRQAVTATSVELTGTPPDDVVLGRPGTVPKTSSGKIRRAEARERYEQGDLTDQSRAVWWQVARLALSTAGPRVAGLVRRVASRVYGVSALAAFVVAALVVWPVVMVLPGLDRRWRVVRGAVRLVVALVGSRLSVDGWDHIPRDGPFVLVANHASHVDPLVPTLLLERPPMFTVIAGVADRWFVRMFLRRMQVRLVERGDRVDGSQVTRDLVEVLRSGRPVVFFPEGRRTPRPGLEQFRMGAFVVAGEAGVPVVPVAIRGTRDILPVGSTRPRRASMHVTVAPPLTAERSGWEGAVDLRDRARAAILDACGEPDLLG